MGLEWKLYAMNWGLFLSIIHYICKNKEETHLCEVLCTNQSLFYALEWAVLLSFSKSGLII